ncbi:MAG: cell division protein FtsX [Paracoccaceae bacterium]|nr:cell division protein FtsX [Paracoccaceae bacterium]
MLGDARADRVVPPTGFTATLTLFASGAMAFLAVFALALAFATGRLAERWEGALAQSATIRLSAPDGEVEAQIEAALTILGQTPGVASARVMSQAEQAALLAPWFGPDLPLDLLPVPRLIEITETGAGFDAEGLRFRLAGEAPGAVLDDHSRWRRPLAEAAARLRTLGVVSLGLIGGAMGAMITLAAGAALSANAQIIGTLRLVGARDVFIARAFVRRFTLRAAAGSAVGTAAAMAAIAVLPPAGGETSFLTGLGFRGLEWVWPLAVPVVAAIVAFWATRLAALARLRTLP